MSIFLVLALTFLSYFERLAKQYALREWVCQTIRLIILRTYQIDRILVTFHNYIKTSRNPHRNAPEGNCHDLWQQPRRTPRSTTSASARRLGGYCIGISPWFRDHLKSTYATSIEAVHKDIVTSAVKAGKFVQFRSSCTSDELHGIAIGYPGGQGIAWCTSRQGSETSTPKLKESWSEGCSDHRCSSRTLATKNCSDNTLRKQDRLAGRRWWAMACHLSLFLYILYGNCEKDHLHLLISSVV